MNDVEIKQLVESWLNESRKVPGRNGFAFVYSEGWKSALVNVMGRMDDWLREQKQSGKGL